MPRKPADQTVQREDILVAAAAVFRERGYQGATMADIARQVGLTAGSLYHHFPAGKRDLLLAVLNKGMDIVIAQIDTILAAGLPPVEALRQVIIAHVTSLTENVAVGAALVFEIRTLMELSEDPDSRNAFLRRRAEFEKRYRQIIERGIADQTMRSVDVPIFTKALLGAHNWIGVWYHPGGRLSGREIADQIADIFLSALHPKKQSTAE